MVWLLLAALAPAGDGDVWQWDLPPGYPRPLVPPDNPMTVAKVELGRRLFHDTRLSGSGRFACATCHRPELAFSDGRERAVGDTGQLHLRNVPALTNVAYNSSYTWADPGVVTLEQQARIPMFNEHPVEMGLAGNEDVVLDRLRSDEDYAARFSRVFPADGEPVNVRNVVRSLAAFERSLIGGGRSDYSRLVYGGEMDALSPSARRGMRLFFSERTQCAGCHAGFNFSGPVAFEGLDDPIAPTFHHTGLDAPGGAAPADSGLAMVTGRVVDVGRFRAPSLHNVALTGPYMHDGSVATLEGVVELYAAGGRGAGRDHPNRSARIRGFEITEGEKRDLVQFLHALTDPAFSSDPRFSSPFD